MREDYKVIFILFIKFIKLEIKMCFPFLSLFEMISLYLASNLVFIISLKM